MSNKMEKNYSRLNYEEQEKLIPDKVVKLRKILDEKHNILVPDHCDDFIARCLRMRNGNVENAIKLINEYVSAIDSFSEWDATFYPSLEEDLYKQGTMMPISQRDSEGRIVCIGRIGMWEPDTMSFDQAAACIWMLLQFISAVSKDTQRNGIVTIWDFSGFSMKHLWAVNKWRIPFLARIAQYGLAGKLKELHVINHSTALSWFYSSVIKPLLVDRAQKMIVFHNSLESLHSRFDKNRLPTFVGGYAEVEDCMDWDLMNDFFRHDQYFIDMMNDRFPRF